MVMFNVFKLTKKGSTIISRFRYTHHSIYYSIFKFFECFMFQLENIERRNIPTILVK